MKHIGHIEFSCFRIDHLKLEILNVGKGQMALKTYLCWYSGLNIIVLCVADLGVEIQQWPNLYWGFEPNIIHVHAEGSWFTEISRFWKVIYEGFL